MVSTRAFPFGGNGNPSLMTNTAIPPLIVYTCFPVRREWKHRYIFAHNLRIGVKSTRAFPFGGNGNAVIVGAVLAAVKSTRAFPFGGNGNVRVS